MNPPPPPNGNNLLWRPSPHRSHSLGPLRLPPTIPAQIIMPASSCCCLLLPEAGVSLRIYAFVQPSGLARIALLSSANIILLK